MMLSLSISQLLLARLVQADVSGPSFCASVSEALAGTRLAWCDSFPVNPHQAATVPNTATLFHREPILLPWWSSFPLNCPAFERSYAKSQETLFSLQMKPGTHLSETTVQPPFSSPASSPGLLGGRGSSGDLVSAPANSADMSCPLFWKVWRSWALP